ncbi:hypothetical protein [Flavobacterium selenitireducens]|uniref:hypothetical protein n=1 Tax=Flavobacterium selenitireducens TaxID=2722704 RepID=UPI00168B42B9|nr:hypothetical protein [Flavobacterium selenitireducens]MBD3582387.1 hypothetical protein [Flavobacterium selenitireducens]
MKKTIVLLLLFVVPIVAYLFFASGVHSFTSLPVITPQVPEFGAWESLDKKEVKLEGRITVLGFGGFDIVKNRGNIFNLNQKVFERYHGFEDLQFVYVCPMGTEKEVQAIYDKCAEITDMSTWKFVFAKPEDIMAFHSGLKVKSGLNKDFGTSDVYLIDKKRQLRGRNDGEEFIDGYDTFHPSEISNKFLDDFKVLLYEYKSAFKRNNNATKRQI